MFIAALFTTARTRKQSNPPSTDKWIKKLWYVYIMEYYSVIKKNKSESVVVRWINLEPVIQSKASQKEKKVIKRKPGICMESRKMVLMSLAETQWTQWGKVRGVN